MEIAKYKEAEVYIKTIRLAERILEEYDRGGFYPNDIVSMIESNKQVQRSFIRWIKNEKQIAEQKLKEI